MSRRLSVSVLGGLLATVVPMSLLLSSEPAAAAAGLSVGGTPLAGAEVPNGSTVVLSAPGAVSVSWVLDGVYVGRDVQAPFELVLATEPGSHKVKARSETASGSETTYQVQFLVSAQSTPPAGPSESPAPGVAPEQPSAPAPSSAPPGGPTTRLVRSSTDLQAALDTAAPGQVIELADGTYRGTFDIGTSGTANAPIVLRGGPGAVLDGGSRSAGYALHLDGADHWRLHGFTVRGAQKGIVLDGSDHNVLSSLDVGSTGMEAVHFRSSSSDNRLQASAVHHTGLVDAGFGEGVYIGSAESNWSRYGESAGPDRSDRNVVTGNRIYAVTAENIDVKEGTTAGVISENTFDGAAMTGEHYADSWIDLKGNGYLVTGNSGVNTRLDGFQTHVQLPGWGRDNVFRGNRLAVDTDGFGINIYQADSSTGNVVTCDNVVTGAGRGTANVSCS